MSLNRTHSLITDYYFGLDPLLPVIILPPDLFQGQINLKPSHPRFCPHHVIAPSIDLFIANTHHGQARCVTADSLPLIYLFNCFYGPVFFGFFFPLPIFFTRDVMVLMENRMERALSLENCSLDRRPSCHVSPIGASGCRTGCYTRVHRCTSTTPPLSFYFSLSLSFSRPHPRVQLGTDAG